MLGGERLHEGQHQGALEELIVGREGAPLAVVAPKVDEADGELRPLAVDEVGGLEVVAEEPVLGERAQLSRDIAQRIGEPAHLLRRLDEQIVQVVRKVSR